MRTHNRQVTKQKRPLFERKDGEGNDAGGQTREPAVAAAVLDEIKKIGASSKENFDSMMRNYTELKKVVDNSKGEVDVLVENKIHKLTEDIVSRQEALEGETTERLDKLEVLAKKIADEGGTLVAGMEEHQLEEYKEAKSFKMQQLIAQKKLTVEGVTDDMIDYEELRRYNRAFDQYLRRYDERNISISPEHMRDLSVGSDPDGGILVTPAVSNRIIEKVFEGDPVRQLAYIETIGTDALEILEDLQEAETGWEGEVQAGPKTGTPQFNRKRIPVHIQYAKPHATQKLLEDATLNVETWLANKVGSRFTRVEGAAFVSGDGNLKPRGFLTYDSGTDYGQVEQVNLGHATLVEADGLIKLFYYLLPEYATRSVWMMNRLTVLDVMQLKDTTDQYLWRPGLQEGQPSLLLGVPVRMSTTMPIVAANALALALADWTEFYTIVDRLGITVQRDPYTVKPFVEFYTRRRVGGDVVNFQAGKIGKIAA